MDEHILESILDEIDHERGRKSRVLLGKLDEELDPIQFLHLRNVDVDMKNVADFEEAPGEDSLPFAILNENRNELDIGLWSINLN